VTDNHPTRPEPLTRPPRVDIETGAEWIRQFVDRTAGHHARATSDRRSGLRAHLPQLTRLLQARGATGVWVFGSLAACSGWSAPHPDSDLDILVDGLSAEMALEAERHVLELHSDIQLIRLANAPATLRLRVLQDGERLL